MVSSDIAESAGPPDADIVAAPAAKDVVPAGYEAYETPEGKVYVV